MNARDTIDPSCESQEKVKCVVWDLDGTVWNGHLPDGEDLTLREDVVALVRRFADAGIVNAIASTNMSETALATLRTFGIDGLFAIHEITLSNKAVSLDRISQRLEVDYKYMCFVDNDPFERDVVRRLCPGIRAISPEVALTLASSPMYQGFGDTWESRQRQHMLTTDLVRERERSRCGSDEEFLLSCAVRFEGRIGEVGDTSRIVEMTNRINRMNASSLRLSHGDVSEIMRGTPTQCFLLGSMTDKYGDYGTVAVAHVTYSQDRARVRGLWMSCRVGKRGLPSAFLTFLATRVHTSGAALLDIAYVPTEANRLAAVHLGTYGFRLVYPGNDDAVFRLVLPWQIRPYPGWITVQPQSEKPL